MCSTDPTGKSAESITSGSNLSSCSRIVNAPMEESTTTTSCFPPSPTTSGGSGIGGGGNIGGADNNNNNSDSGGNMVVIADDNGDDNLNNRRSVINDNNSSNDDINLFRPTSTAIVSEPPAAHARNLDAAVFMANFHQSHLTALPRLPFMPSISFADAAPTFPNTSIIPPRSVRPQRHCQSPLPRRKQVTIIILVVCFKFYTTTTTSSSD